VLLSGPVEVDAAATITVDTLANEVANDDNCSLTEALQAAATNTPVDGCTAGSATGVDVIKFDVSGVISAPTDGLLIASDVRIEGHADGTTINGGSVDINLDYWQSLAAAPANVSLIDLSVTGARSDALRIQDGNDDYEGSYRITLENLHVHDNQHDHGNRPDQRSRGAIHFSTYDSPTYSDSRLRGTVHIKNSLIEHNTNLSGIHSDACSPDMGVSLVVENSIIKDNTAGGISHVCGHMKIVGSTIQGNGGAGVHVHGGKSVTIWRGNPKTWEGTLVLGSTRTEIINSTIAENTSTSGGAGLHVEAPPELTPALSIIHSTIAQNSAKTGEAGGIDSSITAASDLEIVKTVVAGNSGKQCDFVVAPGVNTGNASSDGACDGFAHSKADAELQDPADNSGAVAGAVAVGPHGGNGNILTMAFPTASPLFNGADATACRDADTSDDSSGPTDARGVTRPQGAGCDIGAFEVRVADDITVDTTSGKAEDGECSLDEAVEAANTDSEVEACTAGTGDDNIVIEIEGEINAPADGLVIASDMSIQGHESGAGTTVNGGGFRVVLSDASSSAVASRVALADLTVTGATGSGVRVEDTAAATTATDEYRISLESLELRGNKTGVSFETAAASGRSGAVFVKDSVIAGDTGAGVDAEACDADGDDDLEVANTIIRGNAGGITHHCGDLRVVGSTIGGNTGRGGVDIRGRG